MSGLNFGELMPQRAAPQQEQRPDWYSTIGGIGDAIGKRRQEDTQNDLQQQQLDREVQRDTRAGNREDTAQQLRAREALMSDKREEERLGITRQGENRRESGVRREEADKQRQEREQLFREYQAALQIPDPSARASAVHAAADALRRIGITGEEFGPQFGNPPPPPAPQQERAGLAPVADGSDVGDLQSGRTPGATHAQPQRPMLPGEASSIGRQLDAAGSRYTAALSGKKPVSGKAADSLSAQLDSADATYSKGLGVAPGLAMTRQQATAAADANGALGVEQVPGGWQPIPKAESDRDNNDPSIATPPRRPLPGETPFSVTKSNQFLSQDDPYNSIK